MAKQTSPLQAHGKSVEELQQLQTLQQIGEGVPMAKGSVDKNYQLPQAEKHLVHVEIQDGGFNPQTGEPLGVPRTQKFDAREFDRMVKEQAFAGQKVTILHDPTGEAEDIDPLDALEPQVVSAGALAGLSLVKSLEKVPKPEIEKMYSEHFGPEALKDGNGKAKGKDVLIADIDGAVGFATAEKQTELVDQWNNRFEAVKVDFRAVVQAEG